MYFSLLLLCIFSALLTGTETANPPSSSDSSNGSSSSSTTNESSSIKRKNPPVIIVPGLAGSRIQGKFDGENCPHFWCRSHTWMWKDLWIDFTNFFRPFISCFAHHMGLYLNKEGEYVNNPGVRTRVLDFGGMGGTRYVDKSYWFWSSKIGYLNETEKFFTEKGYTSGQDLHSAPYDWRNSLDGLADNALEVDSDDYQFTFYQRLRRLVEDTSKRNGYKVLLVGHSYGSTLSQHFLQLQSKEWRDTYIHKLVHLAPPYLGSVDAIAGYVTPSFGTKPLNDELDRPTGLLIGLEKLFLASLRTLYELMLPNGASVVSLMPSHSPVPVVVTDEKEYYARDVEEIVTKLNKPYLLAMRKRTHARGLALPLSEPDVDTVVAYCTDLPTPWTYYYRGSLNSTFKEDYPRRIDMNNGDGTVPAYSLEQHKQWKRQPSLVRQFPGVVHNAILENRAVNEFLFSLLPAAPTSDELEDVTEQKMKGGRTKGKVSELLRTEQEGVTEGTNQGRGRTMAMHQDSDGGVLVSELLTEQEVGGRLESRGASNNLNLSELVWRQEDVVEELQGKWKNKKPIEIIA